MNFPVALKADAKYSVEFRAVPKTFDTSSTPSSPCARTTMSTYGASKGLAGRSEDASPRMTGKSGSHFFTAFATSTASRIIGPVTTEIPRHKSVLQLPSESVSYNWAIVESMILTSYPAFNSGVEIARIPNGAVASILEKEGKKNTIFFEDFLCDSPLEPSSAPSD